MKKIINGLLMAIAVVVMVSCSTGKGSEVKGEWVITVANGISTADGDEQATISFDGTGKVNGNSSINPFFGSYTLSGESLKFENIGCTRRLGMNLQVEDAVLDAVNNTASVKVDGNTATVYNAAGKEVMKLERK